MNGVYVLLAGLDRTQEIRFGRRSANFERGFYAYVGSALAGLERRLARHLRTEKKRHWHIDYLLEKAPARAAIYAVTTQRRECEIAHNLAMYLTEVPGFGASDCRCPTHLFHHTNESYLQESVIAAFRRSKLVPRLLPTDTKVEPGILV